MANLMQAASKILFKILEDENTRNGLGEARLRKYKWLRLGGES